MKSSIVSYNPGGEGGEGAVPSPDQKPVSEYKDVPDPQGKTPGILRYKDVGDSQAHENVAQLYDSLINSAPIISTMAAKNTEYTQGRMSSSKCVCPRCGSKLRKLSPPTPVGELFCAECCAFFFKTAIAKVPGERVSKKQKRQKK